MPLYYFDVQDRGGFHRDEFGDDFDTLEDALTQVQALLPEIVRYELLDGDRHTVSCELRDATGRRLYRGELTYRGVRVPVAS